MIATVKKFAVALVFSLFAVAFAEETAFSGLYRYKLDNGLELFVAENDSAPLAYIEIAVRAGAVTQTPQNAGLFHLYEHMLFKGNEKYANQDEFTAAGNALGQIDQNGSTGLDRVNYYFTIPADLIRDGLEFWSYAIRTPKLDEQELENEKSVVLAEITADFTDPAHIRSAALFKTMFPQSPWRLDPSGNPVVVQNATAESLREMKEQYYIPSNSAIFVGGAVEHENVFEYAKEIFGDWQNPPEKTAFEPPESKNPLFRDKKMIFVNPGSSDDMIQIAYYLRGPDGETDANDTYAADVWVNLVNNPTGSFANTFVSDRRFSIPDSDFVGASYPTRRVSSLIGFFAAMMTENQNAEKKSEQDMNYGFGDIHSLNSKTENLNPAEKSETFLSVLKKTAIPNMTNKELFFKDRSVDFVIGQLEDSRTYELESAQSILASLSFFWSACGSDYFFSYDENIARVTEDSVVSFVQNYLLDKSGALVVSVSPGIWAKYKSDFLNRGYEEITAENAFWQNEIAK